MSEIESEQPRQRICEVVAAVVAEAEQTRQQEAAYAVLDNEPKRDSSNPGGAFGKRVAARIATGQ